MKNKPATLNLFQSTTNQIESMVTSCLPLLTKTVLDVEDNLTHVGCMRVNKDFKEQER